MISKVNRLSSSQDDLFIVEYSGSELFFSGDIDFHSAHEFNKLIKQIEREKEDLADKSLLIYLTSTGGEVGEGLKMHDALMRSQLETTVIAEGLVASAATLLLCGAKSARITPNSFLLLHEFTSYFGNTYSNNKRFMVYVDQLMDLVVGIYNKKLKEPIGKADLDKDWFINATEALALGLVDEIIE